MTSLIPCLCSLCQATCPYECHNNCRALRSTPKTPFSQFPLFDCSYLLKLLLGHEIILSPVHLALPGPASGIADAQLEQVGVLVNQHIHEGSLTYFRVTLPTPEGPVITSGRSLLMSLL